MKVATVRDLRTRFPMIEGWLAEGEEVAVTKAGKRIAMLIRADPLISKSLHTAFSKRFGGSLQSEKVTHLVQTLIDDRGT